MSVIVTSPSFPTGELIIVHNLSSHHCWFLYIPDWWYTHHYNLINVHVFGTYTLGKIHFSKSTTLINICIIGKIKIKIALSVPSNDLILNPWSILSVNIYEKVWLAVSKCYCVINSEIRSCHSIALWTAFPNKNCMYKSSKFLKNAHQTKCIK